MRLDEFVLRFPGEEFRLRFHEQLTVLSGVGPEERRALIDSLMGAMTGGADDTVLSCRDHTGRPMELTTVGGRVQVRFLDDGTAGPTPIGWFAPDADALRSLVVLGDTGVGVAPRAKDRPEDTEEITEARAALRDVEVQLDATEEARQRVATAKDALDALDERIRAAEHETARREHAQAIAALERARTEFGVLDGGEASARADRRLLDAALEIEDVAAQWQEAASSAALARSDGLAQIDPVELARWADVPTAPPADLRALLASVADDDTAVATLERGLRDLATATLPEPDDMRVLTLATVDQRHLWEVHRRLVWAEEALEREQVALGGVGTDDGTAGAIDELEAAHSRIEHADAELDRRRSAVLTVVIVLVLAAFLVAGGTGLLAVALVLAAAGLAGAALVPLHRERAGAVAAEQAALDRINVPTYLAFHLRRVDATLDPSSQNRLEVARSETESARRSWVSVAGGISLAVATALEPDVLRYATALSEQDGAVEELAQLRRELNEVAQPALRAAQDRVADALEPYGLGWDDVANRTPAAVQELVSSRIALGRAARGQRAVVDAEAEEEKLVDRLDEMLVNVGIADGPLDDRVAALRFAAQGAADREAARSAARPRADIEADLETLTAEVRRLERSGFGGVRVDQAVEPDIDALLEERRRIHAALAADEPLLIDLDRLAEQHTAMNRRVTTLVHAAGAGDAETDADLAELHQHVLAHLTNAMRVGPRAEPIPVVLDEPFVRVPAERKWELMDLISRLAEKTQLLYLTDDPFIGAWARQRADADSLLLLEPVE